MRPFVLSPTFLSFFSAAASVTAEHIEFIDDRDSRISYSDGWIFINNSGGGTLASNDMSSATASLTVHNASRIAVGVYVEATDQKVRISLDNHIYNIAPVGSQQPAWTSGNIDPSLPHSLQVIKRNPKGQYLALDYILVTYNDPPTTTTVQTTPTAAPTPMLTAAKQSIPSSEPPITPTLRMSGVSAPSSLRSDSSPGVYTSEASSEASAPTSQATGPSAFHSFTSLLAPKASTTFSAEQSNTEPVLTGGKLAGVIIACIGAPALAIVGLVLYRRRKLSKRKAASTAYLEWMAARGGIPPRPPFSPTPPDGKFDVGLGPPTGYSTDPQAVAIGL